MSNKRIKDLDESSELGNTIYLPIDSGNWTESKKVATSTFATSSSLNSLNQSFTTLQSNFTTLQGSVGTLQNNVSALQTSVSSLTSTVGNNNSGLVKNVSDLQGTVGNSSGGLVKDVSNLQTSVSSLTSTIGNQSSGLVKNVNDLQAALVANCYNQGTAAWTGETITIGNDSYKVYKQDFIYFNIAAEEAQGYWWFKVGALGSVTIDGILSLISFGWGQDATIFYMSTGPVVVQKEDNNWNIWANAGTTQPSNCPCATTSIKYIVKQTTS